MTAPLPYSQWFALLTMKHFGAERPGKIIRYQTLRALCRRGWATEQPNGSYMITPAGLLIEDNYGKRH